MCGISKYLQAEEIKFLPPTLLMSPGRQVHSLVICGGGEGQETAPACQQISPSFNCSVKCSCAFSSCIWLSLAHFLISQEAGQAAWQADSNQAQDEMAKFTSIAGTMYNLCSLITPTSFTTYRNSFAENHCNCWCHNKCFPENQNNTPPLFPSLSPACLQ